MTTYTLIFLFAFTGNPLTGRTTIDNFPSAAACEAFIAAVRNGGPELSVVAHSCIEQETL